MKNHTHAVAIITQTIKHPELAHDIADELNNAGLFADELPEPTRKAIPGYHTYTWAEWDTDDLTVSTTGEGDVLIEDRNVEDAEVIVTPEHADTLAAAIRAAKKHATTHPRIDDTNT